MIRVYQLLVYLLPGRMVNKYTDQQANKMSTDNPILFFDGVCNLCNNTVDYVIRHDRSGGIHFASLQSDYAHDILSTHDINLDRLDTIYLLHDSRLYAKSQAALQLLQIMGGWRSVLGRIGRIIPTIVADKVYDWVARNRYRWYGRRETCRLPEEGEIGRFLG